MRITRQKIPEARMRYELRKLKRAAKELPPVDLVVERDEKHPNRINVVGSPHIIASLKMLAKEIRRSLARYRARSPRRKRPK